MSGDKDLIERLKEALIARERRIYELQLALAQARSSAEPSVPSPSQTLPNQTLSSQPPFADADPLPKPFDAFSCLAPETSGVYADFWTELQCNLVFTREVLGRRLSIGFYLPWARDRAEKALVINPSFAPRVTLGVGRGALTSFSIDVPPDLDARAALRLEAVEREADVGRDVRWLGVNLANIELGAVEARGPTPSRPSPDERRQMSRTP